ncbi:hypothetical protein NIA69_09560 [Gemmiger formicilis]|nr:hypothetical protein [Gemmiger formicilis]
MTKREARAWAKARRTELDMAAVGRGMAQALFSLPQWQRAGAVLAFAAMPDEPDTAEILRRALADGKRLLLPACGAKPRWTGWRYRHCACCGPGRSAFRSRPPTCPPPTRRDTPRCWPLSPAWPPAATGSGWGAAAGIMTDFWHTIRERAAALPRGPAAGRAALRRLGRTLCAREYSDRERNFTMKKLLLQQPC